MTHPLFMFPIAMNEFGLCTNFGTLRLRRLLGLDQEFHITLPNGRVVSKASVTEMHDARPRYTLGSSVVMARPDLDDDRVRMPRTFWTEVGTMTVCKMRWYPTTGFLYMVEELPIEYQRWFREQQLAVPMDEDVFSVLDALRISCDPDTLEKVRAGLRNANKEHVVANL